ncbi:phage major capsid protein [Catellatospora sp. NPDC049609]|uniref:phage major capsid protein n=1 Tax=Catellatospora sp. NPDC049609 TaxID=3155505 RepID=UPI00342CF77E
MQTLQEMRDERARVLAAIDDILNTAREAGRSVLDDAERTRHDELVAQLETPETGLDALIARSEVADGDAARFAAHATRSVTAAPMINVAGPSARGSRSLDELLWATDETVPAGDFDKTGTFRPNAFGARASVEQVVVRGSDGGAVYAPRIGEFAAHHRGAVRAFQQVVTDMVLFGLLIDKQAKSSGNGFEVARSHRIFKDRWNNALRAMDVDTAGEGGNWVPTGIGSVLHEKVRAAGKIAPLFSRIDLPANPWKWPVEGADATAYRVAEPTGDTETKMAASTPGTVAPTFDAEIFGARALFSRSLEADSAYAILPYVRKKIVQAFVDAEEKAVLDGDSDGTHQDSDVGASTTDARTAWDGLRKRALANAGQALTAVTSANIATLRKSMGKWGLNPAEMALILGVSGYHQLLGDANLITVDKAGPQATILNGQIGWVYGVPVIVSEHVRENLNATGVYDGTTTTKTYFMLVNRNEWAFGQRMALDVEVDDSIYRETYQRVMVGFMREDFQNIGDAASNDDTAVGFNTTP